MGQLTSQRQEPFGSLLTQILSTPVCAKSRLTDEENFTSRHQNAAESAKKIQAKAQLNSM
ncbi:hypothetical protein N0002_07210 [Pseudomonas aeruginosa]|uniref:Uncharacterized protein n=1 Tax=Pseudomonas aeruginosa TaxID=287 RepID=A0A7M3A2C0_PSEAI|nr:MULTISPECIES: hypothetical protein [Pseudomonas]HCL2588090.1 hypothetical protein [Pseudomonas aeruginosa C40A]ALZ19835.1 hypothetical protein HV97_14390 [Pseudomonas aeruginosa]AYW72305.1 hypothetical protein EGV95_13165 [Pseudomonas aeruginosa]EIU7195164.1 hypothetical protein [Pseudomonas aeruginosa]EKU0638359.1 hypothetical protein [Pseudomonas aeruginosa]